MQTGNTDQQFLHDKILCMHTHTVQQLEASVPAPCRRLIGVSERKKQHFYINAAATMILNYNEL